MRAVVGVGGRLEHGRLEVVVGHHRIVGDRSAAADQLDRARARRVGEALRNCGALGRAHVRVARPRGGAPLAVNSRRTRS